MGLGVPELIIILFIILIIFGAIGSAIKNFKGEVTTKRDDKV
jgi:hypothetical protein